MCYWVQCAGVEKQWVVRFPLVAKEKGRKEVLPIKLEMPEIRREVPSLISCSVEGSLVTIDFHPLGNFAAGADVALVASVNPTGSQEIWTRLEDMQGAFALSFSP